MKTERSDSIDATPKLDGVLQFPQEISRFFIESEGQVLLVNGRPGTGKTLLTIMALDILKRDGTVLYVTTRVDDESAYEMYFADLALDRSNILDLSQDPFTLPLDVDVPFDKLDLDSLVTWIQQLGEASKRITIAFDSWELVYAYLAARHENSPDIETVTNQVVSLARQEDIRLVLVSETAEAASLEYIVDGVVSLQVTEDNRGRPQRQLLMEKLRGVRIENRHQPITLAGGQFQVLTSIELSALLPDTGGAQWNPRTNSKTKFSTGIRNFDRILSGGYNRGSMVHLELGTDLPRDAWGILTIPTIRNFLSNEMSVSVLPPREASPGLLHNDLTTVLPSDVFDEKCHIFSTYVDPTQDKDESDTVEAVAENSQISDRSMDFNGSEASTVETNDQDTRTDTHNSENDGGISATNRIGGRVTGSFQGSEFDYRTYITTADRIREKDDGPLLHVISMEMARSVLESHLNDFANYVSLRNDLAIIITKEGSDFRTRADPVADMHFVVERSGKALVLYGENPLTPLQGIGIDRSQAIPEVVLTEMV